MSNFFFIGHWVICYRVNSVKGLEGPIECSFIPVVVAVIVK